MCARGTLKVSVEVNRLGPAAARRLSFALRHSRPNVWHNAVSSSFAADATSDATWEGRQRIMDD